MITNTNFFPFSQKRTCILGILGAYHVEYLIFVFTLTTSQYFMTHALVISQQVLYFTLQAVVTLTCPSSLYTPSYNNINFHDTP